MVEQNQDNNREPEQLGAILPGLYDEVIWREAHSRLLTARDKLKQMDDARAKGDDIDQAAIVAAQEEIMQLEADARAEQSPSTNE